MLGPSGSGKTTVLRMIAGFEPPTAGAVQLDGRDVTGCAPFERDVNTVFQDYALFPHMTASSRTSSYGLRVEGRRQGRAPRTRPREALATVRLEGLRPAPPRAALRRTAAAGRAGPRAGQPAQGAAAGRAARRARPQAARADAGRAQGDPARGRHHLRLRHPRPGRGADDERPDRGLRRRPDRAGRHRPRRSTSARRPRSSPGSSAPPTCSRRRPPRQLVGADGTFSVRPEKIRVRPAESRRSRPDGEVAADGRGRRGRLRRRRDAAASSTSTPGPSSWPLRRTLDVLGRARRPAGQPGPAPWHRAGPRLPRAERDHSGPAPGR